MLIIKIRHAVLKIFEKLYKILEQLFGIFLSNFLAFSEQNLERPIDLTRNETRATPSPLFYLRHFSRGV